MSNEARRYRRMAIGVLCSLSVMWTVTTAAPQSVPASPGWGHYPQSSAEAARFLEYSTWGPTPELIIHLGQVGYARFLDEQFAAPMSSYQDFPIVPNTRPDDCTDECQRDNYTLYPVQTRFYTNALYGNDQLRQRVAFALHQMIVVSGADIGRQPSRFAPYLKILDSRAFGNFRDLLHDITLNPAMGNYLDMAGNRASQSERKLCSRGAAAVFHRAESPQRRWNTGNWARWPARSGLMIRTSSMPFRASLRDGISRRIRKPEWPTISFRWSPRRASTMSERKRCYRE